MSLVTKTIDSRILDKEMKLAVYRPAVNDNSALPVLYFLHGRTESTASPTPTSLVMIKGRTEVWITHLIVDALAPVIV